MAKPCKRTPPKVYLNPIAIQKNDGICDWRKVQLTKVMGNQAWMTYCMCGWKTPNIYSSVEHALTVYYEKHLHHSKESAILNAGIDAICICEL